MIVDEVDSGDNRLEPVAEAVVEGGEEYRKKALFRGGAGEEERDDEEEKAGDWRDDVEVTSGELVARTGGGVRVLAASGDVVVTVRFNTVVVVFSMTVVRLSLEKYLVGLGEDDEPSFGEWGGGKGCGYCWGCDNELDVD